MKKFMFLLCFIFLGWMSSAAEVGVGISFGTFYSSLGAYGEWIPVDGDIYAWRPLNVVEGWRPYLHGRWMWTNDGWYWASDEPWSWATYHYGRWYYDNYYGWLWTPGYEWAPAWVEWRYGGDYVGWAPLGPYAVFTMNFGIHYPNYWVTPYDYWSFVDCRHIATHDVHRHVYRTDDNTRIIGRTRTAGSVRSEDGRVVARGVEPAYIERRGNVRIERADLVDVADRQRQGVVRSGDHERVEVYRPRVEERLGGIDGARPARVREAERTPSIDTRHIDVRSREQAREAGRDLQRAEQYRLQRQVIPDGRVDRDVRSLAPRDLGRDMRSIRPREPDRITVPATPRRVEPERRVVQPTPRLERGASPGVRSGERERSVGPAPSPSPSREGGERSRSGEGRRR